MGLRGPLPRRRTKPAATAAYPLPAPAWLPTAAAAIWDETEPRLRAAGRLQPEHADILGNWCATAAELRALASVLASDGSTATGPHGTHPSAAHSAAVRLRGTLLVIGKALGLDPASSARLEALGAPAGDADDLLAAFVAKRDQPSGKPPRPFKPGATVLDIVRGEAG